MTKYSFRSAAAAGLIGATVSIIPPAAAGEPSICETQYEIYKTAYLAGRSRGAMACIQALAALTATAGMLWERSGEIDRHEFPIFVEMIAPLVTSGCREGDANVSPASFAAFSLRFCSR